MTYTAPVPDMLFILRHIIGADRLRALPGQDGLPDLLEPVLAEAAKLAEGVLAPLNHDGDKKGAVWKDGAVATAPGWREAYAAYRDGGWNGVPFSADWGGQGLPWCVAFPVQEMWQSANMAFGLCPLLNQGAVEAIAHHGTDEQKAHYLPRLVSGEWTGTMNLTEPQAGSDLAAIRTRAERAGDGTYRITGQKIFITYGEHDLADNIIHLVLARLPDAPAGVKGISLFIVPKILADGTRNDLKCASIEHKLGIHASPTCTMAFGDGGGATGYLVGAENEGIRYMFTMMNNARLSVGLQGVAICERATQRALAYARDRVQGGKPIAAHPDVKRMLLTMQACTLAGRIMASDAAYAMDCGDRALVDLMTPIVKGWCTDRSVDVASLGVQVHGGMGFIEETGAAQYYRDARILPIYEGTNGIQAQDLVFRKVLRDEGAAIGAWMDGAKELLAGLPGGDDFSVIRTGCEAAVTALMNAVSTLKSSDAEGAGAVSHPFLTLAGHVVAGVALTRAAMASHVCLAQGDFSTLPPLDHDRNIQLARFFATHVLPQCAGLAQTIRQGQRSVVAAAF